ncbi:MAG: alpha/beta hydrolase [Planctomycetota bacterium]|jgi:esterase/lipase superfamily enzyme
MKLRYLLWVLPVYLAALLSGCGRTAGLVPTPVVYRDDRVQTLAESDEKFQSTTVDIFYVTERKPHGNHYGNSRGQALRLGTATMRFGDEDMTWEKLLALTFSSSRRKYIPVHIDSLNQMGALTATVSDKLSQKQPDMLDPTGQKAFAQQINAALAESEYKDINIYLHGAVTDFFHALSTSAGFYHYLSREGAMIAYSWRTIPGVWNYPGDVRRAREAVPHLAELLKFLAEHTDAKRINMISYSAGGALMAEAMIQIRNEYPELNEQQLQEKFRIGTAIFASSDIDLVTFSKDMLPQLYDVPREIVVLLNKNDGPLALAGLIHGASRLGRPNPDELSIEELEYLAEVMEDKLSVVDAVAAMEKRTGGKQTGHDYWYRNDWVLTDVLAVIAWNLPPEKRGLERVEGKKRYHFPTDYPQRIADQIVERNKEGAKLEP